MLIPNKFNGHQPDGRRTYPVGGGVGEAMLLGAAVGGGSSALAGGRPKDILRSALLGGATGGIGAGITGALAGGTAGTAAGTAAGGTAGAAAGSAAPIVESIAVPTATQAGTNIATRAITPSITAGSGLGSGLTQGVAGTGFQTGASGMGFAPSSAGTVARSGAAPVNYSLNAGPTLGSSLDISNIPLIKSAGMPPVGAPSPSFTEDPVKWWKSLSGKEKLLYGGGAGIGALMIADRMNAPEMPEKRKSVFETAYRPFDPRRFNPRPMYMAEGGIASLAAGGYDKMVGEQPMYQRQMARGGISSLGSYSDGGRMLRGPGDGMSDSIPGVIAGKRPARLADGEFVIPADVVSHLGNGSTDAGARQLYAMMAKVRRARTGRKKQGREINPRKFMPA